MTFLQTFTQQLPFFLMAAMLGILWAKIKRLEKKMGQLDIYHLGEIQKIHHWDIKKSIQYADKMQFDTITFKDFLYHMSQRDLQFEKDFGHLRKSNQQERS